MATIHGLGSVFPEIQHKQSDIKEAFLKLDTSLCTPDFVHRVFDHTMIDTCGIPLPQDQLFKKMSRSEYVPYVKENLKILGMGAAQQALAEWGGDKSRVTHIVWGTMTGTIHAPSMDIELLLALGLPRACKRLNVESMGCLTGFRCMGLALDIAKADPAHVVLVVVADIRSALGNQLPPLPNKSDVIVCSLFRDSGGAAIVSSGASDADSTHGMGFEMLVHHSFCIPDTYDFVKYHEADDATIRLYIGKEVPDSVASVLPEFVTSLTEKARQIDPDFSLEKCVIACHTGGPKVLRVVQAALGVPEANLFAAWHVMTNHGNLSGSSNIVVLDHVRKFMKKGSFPWCICISFGPGLCVEGILVKVHEADVKAGLPLARPEAA